MQTKSIHSIHSIHPGNPMDSSGSEHNEFRYQYMGYAKYADIARLFGWEVMQRFHYQENLDANAGIIYTTNREFTDSRTLRLSIAAGVDITPLIRKFRRKNIHMKSS